MPSDPGDLLEIDGRRLSIRHLERVVFPRTGTTKGEVLAYYVRVSDAMLPHLRGRLLHMHRYPEGVEGPRFWQKDCPGHRPEWMATTPVWSRAKGTDIHYCEVALRLRDLLSSAGLQSVIKTSGSKGLQVYAPLNSAASYAQTKPLARSIAESLEADAPDRIVSRMAKAQRPGKVFIDWSQNTEHKSMVCAYSVRAKAQPTVSTPVAWDELQEAISAGDRSALSFEMDDVLRRVEQQGDLFADVLKLRQEVDVGGAGR